MANVAKTAKDGANSKVYANGVEIYVAAARVNQIQN